MDRVKKGRTTLLHHCETEGTYNVNDEIGLCLILLFGKFHVPGWLVSSAPDSLWKVVHGLRMQQSCLVNAFSVPRFQSLDLDFF